MADYSKARRAGDDPAAEEAAKAEQPGLAQASVTGESGLAGQKPQPGKSKPRKGVVSG
jgi:hypothetical protein